MNTNDRRLTGRALTLVRPPAAEGDAPPDPRPAPVAPPVPAWREAMACAVGLGVLALVVFGRHVTRGSFYNDDWYLAATYRFAPEPGFVGAVDALSWMAFRPVAMVYFMATYALFGTDPTLHLAWALVLAVAVSAALYSLLRLLDFAVPHAAAVAALLLVFPASDSTRLWASATIVNLGILLGLVGLYLAVRGARARTGTRSLAWHTAALLFYVLAVLAYEITAPAIACAAVLYLGRFPRRAVLLRWAADVLAAGGSLAIVTLVADSVARIGTVDQHLQHAATFARESVVLLARAAFPIGRPSALLTLVLVAVAAGSAWAVRHAPGGDPRRRLVLRWLRTAGAGAGIVVVGYLPFVPARLGVYRPLVPGQGNRVNALAAVGFVLVVHSVAAAAGTAALGGRTGVRGWSTAVALAVAILVGAGYAAAVQPDLRHWDAATVVQRDILSDLGAIVPGPAPGSVIVTFGHRQITAPGVTTFATPWDLDGAVKLAWNDATLSAYPLLWGANLHCQATGFAVPGMAAGPPGSVSKRVGLTGLHRKPAVAPYGRALLVDLRADQAVPINTEADCLRARERVTATWREIPRPARFGGR